jgi:hypothetical protein
MSATRRGHRMLKQTMRLRTRRINEVPLLGATAITCPCHYIGQPEEVEDSRDHTI